VLDRVGGGATLYPDIIYLGHIARI
jgi:hypothetical protein